MKTQLLAAAALVIFSVGAPVASLAADGPQGFDRSKLRQLVVEPKATIVAEPKGVESTGSTETAPVLAFEPKGVEVADTGSKQLVVEPQPIDPGNFTTKIAVNPEGVDAPDNVDVNVQPIVAEPEGQANDEPEVIVKKNPNKPFNPRPIQAEVADSEPEFTAPAPQAEPEAPAVAEEEAAPAEKAPVASVETANGLYTLLTDKGYKVEIIKQDSHGREVFYVTPSSGEYAYLLLVDAYGKVLEKRAIALAANYDEPAYEAPAYKAPAYKAPTYAKNYSPAPAYEAPTYTADAYGDNCETNESTGY